MVSQTQASAVMSASCVDFAQHAWKKDVCCNCQRPRSEHPSLPATSVESSDIGTDSPKPAKRNSVMTKSWIKTDENEDDQWNAMCLPDPDHPNKRLDDTDQSFAKPVQRKEIGLPEHCYEDIDSEDMKKGQGSLKDTSVKGHAYVNTTGESTLTVSANKTIISINPEERLNTLLKDDPRLPSNSAIHSRSRSSSREKSPVPAPKPNIANSKSQSNGTESMQSSDKISDIKAKKGQRNISFVERDPSVIGDDGGLDNLYSDTEEEQVDELPRESIQMSETEKDWALQSLKNTLWNAEHINDGKKKNTSKEFEDINKVDSHNPEMFANTKDGDAESHNFGTFPLKKKSEKNIMDNMFSGNRLSTLSESSENVVGDIDDKYESVLKFLGADKLDFHSSPKHNSAIRGDNVDFDASEASYDDPWGDRFAFDAQSEMNLLDEIKGEIDLDSSTAGFALVDLLNDVLAKYSTGPPSETDSVRNLDMIDDRLDKIDRAEQKEGAEKNAEIEAKIVTLAANLRKHRAKGRAPRPPSCPPQPPQEGGAMSPAKQAEIRAAQSKEPTFKMVPLGKSIGPNPLQAAQSGPIPTSSKLDISSTSSSNSSDNTDMGRGKGDKQAKKGGGGIGGFFSRIFGRGKEADSDCTASSDTLVSSTWSMADPYVDMEPESQGDKGDNSCVYASDQGDNSTEGKRTSKSSPQMKLKVLPSVARPTSPRPVERLSQQSLMKKDGDSDSTTSQLESPKLGAKASVKAEKSENNSSQTTAAGNPTEIPPSQLSPAKGDSQNTTKAVSPKSKEAPPLPQNPPREITDGVPKPRARGNSEGGPPRSRPRKRDSFDGKPRDIPNAPPPKPPVALKPKAPVVQTKSLDNTDKPPTAVKERVPSTSSLEETLKTENGQRRTEIQKANDPRVLRKRAKSPKRFAAPLAPGRASLPNMLTDSNASLASTTSEISVQSLPIAHSDPKLETKNLAFTKELEQKLLKEQSCTTEGRKLAGPPAPPPMAVKINAQEKSKSLPVEKNKIPPLDKSRSLPPEGKHSTTVTSEKDDTQTTHPSKEITRKTSASKDDLKTSPPTAEDKCKTLPLSSSSSSTETDVPLPSTSVPQADIQVQPEKIELPKPAGNSRKSFLGKLNRSKHKPPPPPSVKRTKSVTESTILSDHQTKKIDLKDISGPVVRFDPFFNT